MPRWNNPNCGFKKGHKKFASKGDFKKGHVPWTKGNEGIHLSVSSEFKKGSTPWNKGKKLSKEYRNKLSLSHKGVQAREKHPMWKGGRYSDGRYILVHCPDHPHKKSGNTVYEHRLVMEKHLGRYLSPKEIVHHKNEIKIDNRIENLEIMTRGHHTNIHSPNT